MTLLTYKTKDRDKGIASIAYNNIGLVDSILFDTGAKVLYTYGINGEKLRVRHYAATSNMVSPLSHSPFLPSNPVINTSNYDEEKYIGGDFVLSVPASGAIFASSTYKYYFGDGYISFNTFFAFGSTNAAKYYYYSKDHLGNVRSVVTKNESTNAVTEVQKTHYYPFGGIIADLGTGRSVQNRLYNGKELDTSNNLWWYDYGARQYDPTAPRFTTADPLAERNYNTDSYVYCGNNPVMRIDPDGRDDYFNEKGEFLKRTNSGADVLMRGSNGQYSNIANVDFSKNLSAIVNIGSHYLSKYDKNDFNLTATSIGDRDPSGAVLSNSEGTSNYDIYLEEGHVNAELGNCYNFESIAFHESTHRYDSNTFGGALGEVTAILRTANECAAWNRASRSYILSQASYAESLLNSYSHENIIPMNVLQDLNKAFLGYCSFESNNNSVEINRSLSDFEVCGKRKK